MKKLAAILAVSAVLFGLVSCGSTQAEEELDDLSMFMATEETSGPEWTPDKKSDVASFLKAMEEGLGCGVKLVADKDMSKAGEPEVKGAMVSTGTCLGEKCIRITPNYNAEIRFSFVFDKPVKGSEIKRIEYAIAGFEMVPGTYNFGLALDEMNGAERSLAFFLSDGSAEYWTNNYFTQYDTQWGTSIDPDKEYIFLQFWSASPDPVFLKDLYLGK